MPYYQREWNIALGDQKSSNRKLRTCPATDERQSNEPSPSSNVHVDKMKFTFKREMLKKQVEEIQNTKCSDPVKDDTNFPKYIIQKNTTIFQGKYLQIYPCSNVAYGENQLICRIYHPNAIINPDSDLFLRILRHLGKKHPFILPTMDIFSDENKQIYIFQEFANKGNLTDYMRAKFVTEKQMAKWAQSIYRAMEYLGDVGIVHRSIQPKHILLKATSDIEIIAKLSSFQVSTIYWDPEAKDIIDQPCKPLSKRIYYGFQAPEVFGFPGEFFNPVDADLWSFGATMFFVVSRVYPYNLKTPSSNLDAEIEKSVAESKFTDGAKNFFLGVLQANTFKRTRFDAIVQNAWFKSS